MLGFAVTTVPSVRLVASTSFRRGLGLAMPLFDTRAFFGLFDGVFFLGDAFLAFTLAFSFPKTPFGIGDNPSSARRASQLSSSTPCPFVRGDGISFQSLGVDPGFEVVFEVFDPDDRMDLQRFPLGLMLPGIIMSEEAVVVVEEWGVVLVFLAEEPALLLLW